MSYSHVIPIYLTDYRQRLLPRMREDFQPYQMGSLEQSVITGIPEHVRPTTPQQSEFNAQRAHMSQRSSKPPRKKKRRKNRDRSISTTASYTSHSSSMSSESSTDFRHKKARKKRRKSNKKKKVKKNRNPNLQTQLQPIFMYPPQTYPQHNSLMYPGGGVQPQLQNVPAPLNMPQTPTFQGQNMQATPRGQNQLLFPSQPGMNYP
jgi:hypothetical protein